MANQVWFAVLSALITIAIFFMGAILVSFRNFKKDFQEKHKEYCEQNEKDHEDIWDRVNNHGHKIECVVKDCKPRTAGVLINE